MTPPCSRCGFEIERCEFVYSSLHMLKVQATKPVRGLRHPRRRRFGAEFWVCARCHEPFEEVLTVVKTGKAERERMARPPLVPKFWPRNVLSYDDLRRARAR